MSYGIEHIGLMAQDPEKLATWYQKNLGFRVVYKNSKTPPTFFLAPDSGSMIEIMPYKEGSPVPSDSEKERVHLAIKVDDFEVATADLKKKGVQFIGEPKESSSGVKVVFFQDPEGNVAQLIFRPQPLV